MYPSSCSSEAIDLELYASRIWLFVAYLPQLHFLSNDRFLAVHLHMRYQELMTHKRAVAVIISIWVFSVSISPLFVHANIPNVVIGVI